MTEPNVSPPLDSPRGDDAAWLDDLLDVTASRPELLIHPVAEGQPAFGFDSGVTVQRVELPPRGTPESWKNDLGEALAREDAKRVLVYPVVVPDRPGELGWESAQPSQEEGKAPKSCKFEGETAFLAAVLDQARAGTTVASLVSLHHLTQPSSAVFRRWLVTAHRPRWIVYLGPAAARAMGVESYQMAFLVVTVGSKVKGPPLVWLADLRESGRDAWRPRLESVAEQRALESEAGIKFPHAKMSGEPWAYERFTQSFAGGRKDAAELGPIRRLGDLAAGIRSGLGFKDLTELRLETDASGQLAEEGCRCYGQRFFKARGRDPGAFYWVKLSGVPSSAVLRAGDVLIRLMANPKVAEDALAVVQLRADQVPATCERSVWVLRFKEGIEPEVREMIVGYLSSQRARDWLIASGITGRLTESSLARLEVPYPRAEVLEAFADLRRSEKRYRGWASSARKARQDLFDASSFAETVPRLLERVREERERVRAAEASSGLDYKVRNYYPHPIAARREELVQMPHGKERLAGTLECAEHLLNYLALLAMVQIEEEHDILWRPSSVIRGLGMGNLYFDWGKAWRLVQQGAVKTAKHPHPLQLPFPEMASLQGSDEVEPAWVAAQRRLHKQRNAMAHLQRHGAAPLEEISADMDACLNELLAVVSSLGTRPLVHVLDYELDPVTGERRVELAYHEGMGAAWRRGHMPVEKEIGRGAVGVLDHHDVFRCLSPWLLLETCPQCNSEEIFIFNRLGAVDDKDPDQGKTVHYVELKKGHPIEKRELADRFDALMRDSIASKEAAEEQAVEEEA